MKKLYLLLILFTTIVNAQEPFITTWQVGGTDLTISAPIFNDTNNNNYTIDFGDGTILTNQSNAASHTYTNPGTYTVTISGNYYQIKVNDYDKSQILTVQQWGNAQWTSMWAAFESCYNLTVTATDVPDLSQVTNAYRMFMATDINQPLNNWDVSNITIMTEMFAYTGSFNQPLDNWDVSNVTSMRGMFKGASAFNQPLDNWDVSNVTNMQEMFDSAIVFNQPLNNWDVSSVTTMNAMFRDTETFNQPLNNWDISSATNLSEMFKSAIAFNQPINSWDVSNVTNMRAIFISSAFNQPLDNWDVSSVTDMSFMFTNSYFNQPIDSWDVTSVTTMYSMFSGALAFNQPLNSWDMTSVDDGMSMFSGAISFNQPLNNWDISNMGNLSAMFYGATSFNQDISSWNFNSWSYLQFLDYCGMDSNNYDALLNRLAELEIQDKILDAEGLQYCDSAIRDYMINNLSWDFYGDSLSETCDYNSIHGKIRYDENSNGCNIEDSLISTFLVNANSEQYNFSSTPSNGEYHLSASEGTYTISLMNVPDYYTVTPASSEVAFTDSGNGEELNFCLTPNQNINDLNITLLPIDEVRPGLESHFQLVAENIGTQTINGIIVSLTFDETKQSFVLASQTPSSIAQNQLTFDLGTMLPFERKLVYVTMETFMPPTVNGGETINFVATITPDANDYTPADNTYNLDQVVVNSFDPNDKTILQGDEIYMEQTEGYLDYVIRFQNTGTASAITVRIEDVLHENLDWTTFKPVTSSHDYRVEITDGNQVEFIFDNINLPHEAADEPGSHGFVAYKIKTVEDIAIGDMITGTAGIFFDYNLPIITNSADTEVVEPPLGINEYSTSKVSIYPNPASSVLYLRSGNGISIESIKIYNLQGSEIASFNGNQESIDVKNLSAGPYLLNIQTNQGVSQHRLIKK